MSDDREHMTSQERTQARAARRRHARETGADLAARNRRRAVENPDLWVPVVKAATWDDRLDSRGVHLLCLLSDLQGDRSEAWYPIAQIAGALGWTIETVRRWLAVLTGFGYVQELSAEVGRSKHLAVTKCIPGSVATYFSHQGAGPPQRDPGGSPAEGPGGVPRGGTRIDDPTTDDPVTADPSLASPPEPLSGEPLEPSPIAASPPGALSSGSVEEAAPTPPPPQALSGEAAAEGEKNFAAPAATVKEEQGEDVGNVEDDTTTASTTETEFVAAMDEEFLTDFTGFDPHQWANSVDGCMLIYLGTRAGVVGVHGPRVEFENVQYDDEADMCANFENWRLLADRISAAISHDTYGEKTMEQPGQENA